MPKYALINAGPTRHNATSRKITPNAVPAPLSVFDEKETIEMTMQTINVRKQALARTRGSPRRKSVQISPLFVSFENETFEMLLRGMMSVDVVFGK